MAAKLLPLREAKEILLKNRIGFTQSAKGLTVTRDGEHTHPITDGAVDRKAFLAMVDQLTKDKPAD